MRALLLLALLSGPAFGQDPDTVQEALVVHTTRANTDTVICAGKQEAFCVRPGGYDCQVTAGRHFARLEHACTVHSCGLYGVEPECKQDCLDATRTLIVLLCRDDHNAALRGAYHDVERLCD